MLLLAGRIVHSLDETIKPSLLLQTIRHLSPLIFSFQQLPQELSFRHLRLFQRHSPGQKVVQQNVINRLQIEHFLIVAVLCGLFFFFYRLYELLLLDLGFFFPHHGDHAVALTGLLLTVGVDFAADTFD